MAYHIILYYNFSLIEDPDSFCSAHQDKCRDLELKGRVLIAPEGINGTLCGAAGNIHLYKNYLRGLKGFEDTDFKEDETPRMEFAKLIVKTRPEIVALKTDVPLDPKREGGGHLSPREWRDILESDEDFFLLDARNDYETRIGHFEGAVTPDVRHFWDFPEWLKGAGIPKDKKVLMYCTGGIRCEKFSALMKKEGYRDVQQLSGGIINYAHQEGGAHFKGKCFVFDDRIAVPVDKNDRRPISLCEISGVPCDTYLNCANPDCNRLFICCEDAAKMMEGCCSDDCRKAARRRPFNPGDIYTPFRKWYHYFKSRGRVKSESRPAGAKI